MWDPQWPAFASDRPGRPLRRPRLRRDPAAGRAVVAPRRPARPDRRAGAGPGGSRRDVDGGGDRGRGGPRPAPCGRVAPARGARRRAPRRGRGFAAPGLARGGRGARPGRHRRARSRSTSGPGSTARPRGADAVDPEVRAFVGRMQRDAFELPEWDPEANPEHELSPAAADRLPEIRCPTFVLVGDLDQPATKDARDPDRDRGRGRAARGLAGRRPRADARAAGRLRAARAGVPRGAVTPPAHPALRYVALGDSYTIGTALDAAAERWPDQLVERLRTADGSPLLELVANLGVNGFTSRNVIDVELPQLGRLEPRVRVAARRGQRRRPGRSGRDVRGERGGDPRRPPRHASRRPGS